MSTLVPSPSGDERDDDRRRRVALAAGVAARGLDHDACGRPRRPRRSCAAPLYCAVIGPTFTFTMPRYSSPSISCSCAPGRHGAMRSMSSSTFHASSTGTSTRNCLRSSLVLLLQSFEVFEGVDVGGSPVPCSRPRPHDAGRAPGRPRRRGARAPRARGYAPATGLPGARRRWRRRASPSVAATRRYASAPTSGWSASPMHTASTSARGVERVERGAQARRDALLPAGFSHHRRRLGRVGARDSAPTCRRGSRRRARPARARTPRRVERPRDERSAPPLEQRLRRVTAEARPAARRRGRRAATVNRRGPDRRARE